MPKHLKRARAPSRGDDDDDDGSGFEGVALAPARGRRGADGDGSPSEADGAAELNEDEEVAEAAAAGVIGGASAAAAAASAVNNKVALREAFLGISQDLPWLERLEVVSAEPLGALNPSEDLKVELALCVGRGLRVRPHPPPPPPSQLTKSQPAQNTPLPPLRQLLPGAGGGERGAQRV